MRLVADAKNIYREPESAQEQGREYVYQVVHDTALGFDVAATVFAITRDRFSWHNHLRSVLGSICSARVKSLTQPPAVPQSVPRSISPVRRSAGSFATAIPRSPEWLQNMLAGERAARLIPGQRADPRND